jgi:aminopeptidase C
LKKQIVVLSWTSTNLVFLECMIDLAHEPLESRLIQHLFQSPVGDGGQFDMVIVYAFMYLVNEESCQ